MALVDRVQRIIASPQTEWPVVAAEPSTQASLYSSYILPLAAIGPVCAIVSTVAFLHLAIVLAVVAAVASFLLELVSVFIIALIAGALSPSFNGIKDRNQALKWIAYAYTPRWAAGFLALIPDVGSFMIGLCSLYALYLLYLGVVPVMRVPQEKALQFTIIIGVAAYVLFLLTRVVKGFVIGGAILSAGGVH